MYRLSYFKGENKIGGEEENYMSLDEYNVKTIYNIITDEYGYKFRNMSLNDFKHHVEAYGLYGMDVESLVYELENSRFAAEVVAKVRRPRRALAHTL